MFCVFLARNSPVQHASTSARGMRLYVLYADGRSLTMSEGGVGLQECREVGGAVIM